MNVRTIEKLIEAKTKYPDARAPLDAWLAETKAACWKTPDDVKKRFPSASILAENRVVFNIKGNAYRLIVKINYAYAIVEIRYFGTHAAYDRIHAEKI